MICLCIKKRTSPYNKQEMDGYYTTPEGRKVDVYEAAMEWDSVENDTAVYTTP